MQLFHEILRYVKLVGGAIAGMIIQEAIYPTQEETEMAKLELQIPVRCSEEFYFRVSDAAHKLRTNKASLMRVAVETYLKALEKAETLAA